MALTITPYKRLRSIGDQFARYVDITLPASYTTGGDVVDPALIGFNGEISLLLCEPNGGLVFEVDHTNPAPKLRCMYPTGGSTTSPSTLSDPAISVAVPAGATPVTSSGAQPTLTVALGPGRGKEVKSTTDLSAVTVRALAIGY